MGVFMDWRPQVILSADRVDGIAAPHAVKRGLSERRHATTLRSPMHTAIKAFLLGMTVYPMVCSAQVSGCDAKRSSIESEISYAQAHGNARRIDGLETALA